MIKDIGLILQVYLISLSLQIVAWPWLFKFLAKLKDRGWAMGRTAVSLTVALAIWFGGQRLPVNSDAGVAITLLVLLILTFFFCGQIGPAFKAMRKIGGWLIFEEILFGLGFFGYALVRGFQPDILGLEKFMDFGFIKSYLVSPTLPANDMWWAGGAINYYSFGHFLASILIRIWGVTANVGYNLMLAFILANTLAISFSAVINLIGEGRSFSKTALGGLVGALLVTLGGNSHTLWYWLTRGTLAGYWYADATRFIRNTIHEFPGYSFVVSDLHGHVLSLPVVLAFILLLTVWQKERGRIIEAVLGVLLGVMAMTNTWDALVYGLLLGILFFLNFSAGQLGFKKAAVSAATIGIAAVVTALPWLAGFKSITQGLAAVTERSPFWQLLVLWSVQVGATLTVLIIAVRQKRRDYLVLALGLTAIALILVPEFIYIRDIYPNHPRANTMFKLTYQAFIMMGLLSGWLVGKVAGLARGLIVLFGGLLIFPYLAFSSYYGNFRSYRGLDGFAFLYQRYPDEVEIINYLEKNRNGKNLIEAVGDSYTETNFVSAFAGTPTVVGWRVHEWLWRGGYEEVGKRDEEVRKFFETKSAAERGEIIKKYSLGWVVISTREKQKYKVDEKQIKALGEVAVFGETGYLVKIGR